MNRSFSTLAVILACALMAACSVTAPKAPVERAPSAATPPYSSEHEAIKDKLYSQYQRWKGTRYKMGGLGKNGVDCSGFVYLTYHQQFGVSIPRSTEVQSRAGRKVSFNELQPGDLVFFKTGWKVRHVGIYIDNKAFLHASTSKGVMISRLDNNYWKSKFWHARRLSL